MIGFYTIMPSCRSLCDIIDRNAVCLESGSKLNRVSNSSPLLWAVISMPPGHAN